MATELYLYNLLLTTERDLDDLLLRLRTTGTRSDVDGIDFDTEDTTWDEVSHFHQQESQ